MTTTKSPAETFAQQAEALASQLKRNPYMDTIAKTVVSVGGPLYLAMEGYERYTARQNARNARQRVNRLNRNPSSRSGRGDL